MTGKVDNLRKNAGLCSKAVGEKKKKKEPDGEDLPIPEDLLKSLDNLDKEALTQLSVLQLKTLSKKCAEVCGACSSIPFQPLATCCVKALIVLTGS